MTESGGGTRAKTVELTHHTVDCAHHPLARLIT